IKNAREAMPNGGIFTLGTDLVGEQVVIRMSDTGIGIPAEILGKLFEPFVTHGKSHGTGLGMAMAKSVVNAHQRTISVASVPGSGTTVEIRIPVLAAWSIGASTGRLQAVLDLTDYLRASRRALVFTGAGISTGSGIPDFRGPQGVWTRQQPVYYQDFMSSETARMEHWDYKLEAWESFREAQPNDVHRAIVALEAAGKIGMVVTQNIDGLHTLAGTSRERLVELHGTNSLIECQSCQRRSNPETHFDFFRAQRTPPLCECGGFLKPATISFGQSLEPNELERARHAAEEADLVVALGSTLSVYPASAFPLMAAQRGVPYVIINRGATEHDHESCVSLRIEGEVNEIFPAAAESACSRGR
ncbi:MAG: ATP-binding protein, partial [Verrucomicrobiota bacterium]|nr:ATP-binding protein [Verrucomicrobiota bacterium]